ncbi:MAG TPA: XrtA system polysaccharide deacetylase [Patescibacteria group bacterium]|nr:XrtA system polysaccharide deacetylase [Patescibacteria group bacterium]
MSELARGAAWRSVPDCLSVDVEDYFQVEAFRDQIPPETWPSYPSRVVENTHRVLHLLSRFESRATFFILGWVAERHPRLVREILAAGHEVGCHSYWHRCLWRLSPEEFREDTRRARCAIEDAGGQPVLGYRAPSFSIVERSLWALEILAEEGFIYDSSVFPVHHDVYGLPRAPRFPFRWAKRRGHLLFELPPATTRLFGLNLPAAGGAYLRILPEWYTHWAVRRIRREGAGLAVYFHPWEIDPQQPRLRGRLRSRFRHYFHLDKMEGKLGRILRAGKFVPLIEYLGAFADGIDIESGRASNVQVVPVSAASDLGRFPERPVGA